MNRSVPDGAWCVWRLGSDVEGTGEVVLAQHADVADTDLGGYTVKRLYREEATGKLVLRPDSSDPAFSAIEVGTGEDGALRVVARLVEVL